MTQYEYADSGYLSCVVHPDRAVERFRSDPEGRVVEYRSVAGETSRFTYDAAGQRTEVQVASEPTLGMCYDDEKRLVAIVEQNQRTFEFEYDATGKMIRQQFPDGRVEHYEFNAPDF